MEVTYGLPRNQIQTELSVEEALDLIQKLAAMVNHINKFGMPTAMQTVPATSFYGDDGPARPGSHTFILKKD